MNYRLYLISTLILFTQSVSGQNLVPAIDNRGYYGFKDSTDQFIIPPVYNYVWPFSEGFAKVLSEKPSYPEDSIAFINEKGETVFNRRFLKAFEFKEGFSGVQVDSFWNFINTTGSFIDSVGYEEVRSFSNGYAKVKRNGFWGLIDYEGAVIIPCKYDFIGTPEQKKEEDGLSMLCLREPYRFGFEYFHSIKPSYGAIPVYKDSLWGYTSLKGKEIIPPTFKNIKPFHEKIALAETKDGWIIINKRYKVITPKVYIEVGEFNEKLAAVRKKDSAANYPEGQWGFINTKGKTKVPFEYDRVFFPFNDGFAITGKKKRDKILAGVITEKNKVLIPFLYEEIKEKKSDVFLVKDSLNKWGFYNLKGTQIASPQYGALVPLQNKTIVAEENGSWGLLDYYGGNFIPFIYKKIRFSDTETVEAEEFSTWTILKKEDLTPIASIQADTLYSVKISAAAQEGEDKPEISYTFEHNSIIKRVGPSAQIAYKKQTENRIINGYPIEYGKDSDPDQLKPLIAEYTQLQEASKDLFITQKKGSYGVVSISGTVVIPFEYSYIEYNCQDSIFVVKNGKGYGLADEKANIIMPPSTIYDSIGKFSEGLAVVKKGNEYGFIDRNGKLRISMQYQKAGEFSEGLVAIKLIDKWGFINQDEKIVIQPQFDSVSPFAKEISVVKKGDKTNFLTAEGEVVNSTWYDDVKQNSKGKWILTVNKKKGLADADGTELLSPKYNYVEDLGSGMVKVGKDGKFGLLDYKENFIISITYDNIVYIPAQSLILTKTEGNTRTIQLPVNEK